MPLQFGVEITAAWIMASELWEWVSKSRVRPLYLRNAGLAQLMMQAGMSVPYRAAIPAGCERLHRLRRRLKAMQYRHSILGGFLAGTGLVLERPD